MARIDPDRFSAAYRGLHAQAVRTATSVLDDAAAAEDVVQDVFLELWRNPTLYDPSRGTLRSYVMILTRSRALDRRRTQTAHERLAKRSAAEAGASGPPVEESAAAAAIRRRRSREVLCALQRIPEGQREAILLAYGAGLSSSQIAAVASIPHGTAKSRIRCGLTRMRAELASESGELDLAA
jgi:RNA polymerase sigma-70 factor (ECF subfamily)